MSRIIQHGSALNVDGDNGLGQVVSYRSLEAAIPVAKKLGMAGVFIRRSNHNGTGSFYCQQAMRENMVLIAIPIPRRALCQPEAENRGWGPIRLLSVFR